MAACTVLDGICVADVYASFSSGQLDKSLASAVDVKVGKSRNDMIPVSLDFPVAEMVSNLGHCIDFAVCGTIQNTETMPLSTPVRVRDASTVLMQSSHTCNALPQKWQVWLLNRNVMMTVLNVIHTKRTCPATCPLIFHTGNTLICYFCAFEEIFKSKLLIIIYELLFQWKAISS